MEGVHEQGGGRPEGRDLGAEGVFLAVVQESEGVGGRAHGRYTPTAAGLEVAGRGETSDVGGTGGRHAGVFACAARTHFGERAAQADRDHPRGGARDGTVVVEHAEDEGLEDDALGEGTVDREQR